MDLKLQVFLHQSSKTIIFKLLLLATVPAASHPEIRSISCILGRYVWFRRKWSISTISLNIEQFKWKAVASVFSEKTVASGFSENGCYRLEV